MEQHLISLVGSRVAIYTGMAVIHGLLVRLNDHFCAGNGLGESAVIFALADVKEIDISSNPTITLKE